MRRLRLITAVLTAALAFGVMPAAAGGDYGMWTYQGSGTTWSGTFWDGMPVTGFAIGTKALKKNPVISFVIGGKQCPLYAQHGSAYCLGLKIPKKKKLRWKLRIKKPIKSSAYINPCIQLNSAGFNCRF